MQRLIAAVVVAVAGCSLAGCVGGGPTPSPLTEVTPSPLVSPSPTWNDKQQGALDAVQRYLDVWTDISQHLGDADWNRLYEVAKDPAVNDVFRLWAQWKSRGWHVEGTPAFVPDWINPSMMDNLGNRYHVHGCYDITQTFLVDDNGNKVGERGDERHLAIYTVLHQASDGTFVVLEDAREEGTC